MYKFIFSSLLPIFLFFNLNAQSIQDLQKLKAEYEKIKKNENLLLNPNQNETTRSFNDAPVKTKISRYINNMYDDSITVNSRYYGYNFFVQRDSLSFWQNLPTPTEYLLGPGDELIITLWGETELRKNYVINRDGNIYDEKVGQLNLLGKSIKEAEKYLINQYGKIYATLNRANPTTFIDLSLGKLQSINVNFVGEVNFPGVYTIHPFSNLISGLIQSGGVDTTGSLRNIIIRRNGELYKSIDVYDYLLKGDLARKIQLRDQDIVFIPPRITTISIDSAVVRPGIYEGKLNETISEIINYAGGLKSNASSKIGLFRIIPAEQRSKKQKNSENYYINIDQAKSITIQDGDKLTVRYIAPMVSQVELIGQVKHPGLYYFYEGMRIKDLLDLGGGFNDTTFVKSIYLKNAKIIRRDPNSSYEKVININLNNTLYGNVSENLFLNNLDRFVVHANNNFFERKNVQILGEVNIPGSYPLIKDKETLKSLLNRSGGLTSKALKDGISIFREKKFFDEGIEKLVKENNTLYNKSISPNIPNQINSTELDNFNRLNKDKDKDGNEWIRVAWHNDKIPLMPGDSVVIKRSTGTVHISGEVYNPGFIEFQNNKSLKYYLDAAGGITPRGDKNDVIVKYANGVVSPKKFMSSPKIRDGATIIVNPEEYNESFNVTEFTTTTLSIISTTVTIIVLSQQLNAN